MKGILAGARKRGRDAAASVRTRQKPQIVRLIQEHSRVAGQCDPRVTFLNTAALYFSDSSIYSAAFVGKPFIYKFTTDRPA
jgi:hypothetical protein